MNQRPPSASGIVTTLVLLLALAFIAFDRVLLMLLSPENMATARSTVVVEFVIQTLCYATAIVANFRYLLPRMLYRGRMVAYGASLVGVAVMFTSVEVLFELFIIRYYDVSPGTFWYFSKGSILFFELLSTVASYTISFAGSGVVALVWQWQQSGRRMGELEKRSAQNDLAREKSKIDMQAMLDALDSVAGVVRSAPGEAVHRLMALSKSLREQLYHSDHPKSMHEESTVEDVKPFDIPQKMLDIIIERRYRRLRLLILLVLLLMIGSANFDGSLEAFVSGVAMALFMLGFIALNVYVLVPRFLMRNEFKTYIVLLPALIMVSLLILMGIGYKSFEGLTGLMVTMIVLTNIMKFVFLFCGTSVFVLFQQWLRNELRIAHLATASLRSELELLQNQVNPHFLFNMLNNIIVLTKENPDEAAVVIGKLADMLKYQFADFSKQSIRLGDDIRFLTDYLNLEKLRRDCFDFAIAADSGLADAELPPMLFIPFVENAVKHNNDSSNLSYVNLSFARTGDRRMLFTCINSKPARPRNNGNAGGLGLVNIRRRLDLLYGKHYRMEMHDNTREFRVTLEIPLDSSLIHNS